MYQHILVAVDDSAGSRQALLEAARLVGEGGCLRVVTVVENPRWSVPLEQGALYDTELMRNTLLASGQALLERVQHDLAGVGVKVVTRLVDLTRQRGQSVPEAILKEIAVWPADLLVMGTHGRHGFRRMVIGSVAERVARMSTRPVLLVRASHGHGDDDMAPDCRDYSGRLFSDWPEAEYLSG